MLIAFGGPALMLVAMTIHEIREAPWMVLLWPVAFFPFLVVWTLKRLMTRYALRAFNNGDIEIVFPFKRQLIKREQLSSVTIKSRYVQQLQATQTFYLFGDSSGSVLANVHHGAFSNDQWESFLGALQRHHPSLTIGSEKS